MSSPRSEDSSPRTGSRATRARTRKSTSASLSTTRTREETRARVTDGGVRVVADETRDENAEETPFVPALASEPRRADATEDAAPPPKDERCAAFFFFHSSSCFRRSLTASAPALEGGGCIGGIGSADE
jgi:hypothetical protein